jgi:hypothetical protein
VKKTLLWGPPGHLTLPLMALMGMGPGHLMAIVLCAGVGAVRLVSCLPALHSRQGSRGVVGVQGKVVRRCASGGWLVLLAPVLLLLVALAGPAATRLLVMTVRAKAVLAAAAVAAAAAALIVSVVLLLRGRVTRVLQLVKLARSLVWILGASLQLQSCCKRWPKMQQA